jgi:hypothetical protein
MDVYTRQPFYRLQGSLLNFKFQFYVQTVDPISKQILFCVVSTASRIG